MHVHIRSELLKIECFDKVMAMDTNVIVAITIHLDGWHEYLFIKGNPSNNCQILSLKNTIFFKLIVVLDRKSDTFFFFYQDMIVKLGMQINMSGQ